MLYEMRVYTLQSGKVAAFQELIEKEALLEKPCRTQRQRQSQCGFRVICGRA